MKLRISTILLLLAMAGAHPGAGAEPVREWRELFDGHGLSGWTVSGAREAFRVENGELVAGGGRAMLYYEGTAGGHDFRDFEFHAEVRTEFGSDSGIYFHTEPTDKTWAEKGYEIQVGNDYAAKSQTGSLSGIRELTETAARNGEWFSLDIVVLGNHVTVTVNGSAVMAYEQESPPARAPRLAKRILSSGTFALQARPRKAEVRFRNIRVRSSGGVTAVVPAEASAALPGGDEIIAQGRQAFAEACAACHQTNGGGIAPLYPPLSGSEWVQGNERRLAAIVLYGLKGPVSVKGSVYSAIAMPAFRQGSSFGWADDKIAGVLSYVRQEWGNTAPPVSVETVRQMRSRFGERAEFTEPELKEIP